MLREYQHVCALDEAIEHTAGTAKSRAASGRNRYCNVLPYDLNRVVLDDGQYINASLIRVQLPMLARPCAYIATQGPLPTTAADFWSMVYQQRVPAIVMLTNVNECGVSKCAQYFPAQVGASNLPGFKLQVEQVVPFSPDCTLRVMRLSSSSGGDASHRLCHYHFHAWPDHGTPCSSAGLRAVCRALSTARECGAPVLVHCSAGIGRTGTFCAVDILLQRLDAWPCCRDGAGPDRGEVEAALNLPALVHELRQQRMGMVQTLEQYAFVYQAILDDLQARTKQQQQQQGAPKALPQRQATQTQQARWRGPRTCWLCQPGLVAASAVTV
ncbi:protein-tyrosine phosphatase-like protein [Scenedesmus sp. NREL 46B-D3]|nr:protein-tyrosine phosphatase-like protein [Scenedesmus sp. NREL 46B-D3]